MISNNYLPGIAFVILSLGLVASSTSSDAQQSETETFVYMPTIISSDVSKAGIAWAWHSRRQDSDAEVLGIGWYYTYSVQCNTAVEGVQYIPMFWADRWPSNAYYDSYYSDKFEQLDRCLPEDYADYLLFFNECDLPGTDTTAIVGQCGRTPLQAAYMYKKLVEMRPQAKLVGPAVSHRDYQNDWLWYREWLGYIDNWELPMPDVGAIHTYLLDEPPERIVDSYFDMLLEFPDTATTAWVTEFATCKPDRLRIYLDYYNNDTRIERYSYFTIRGDNDPCFFLMRDEVELTSVGLEWVDFHKEH